MVCLLTSNVGTNSLRHANHAVAWRRCMPDLRVNCGSHWRSPPTPGRAQKITGKPFQGSPSTNAGRGQPECNPAHVRAIGCHGRPLQPANQHPSALALAMVHRHPPATPPSPLAAPSPGPSPLSSPCSAPPPRPAGSQSQAGAGSISRRSPLLCRSANDRTTPRLKSRACSARGSPSAA